MAERENTDLMVAPFTEIRIVPLEEERLTGERLRTLVFEENERLKRLIRNLYLKFRLERYPEAELFDHICRELAQYFHADACSLFLIRYERTQNGLKPWLELVGAFGPWQEALRPQKVRQKQATRYDLEDLASLTSRAYYRKAPTFLPSRQYFELSREVGKKHEEKRWEEEKEEKGKEKPGHEEPARHLVWRYTNLYYTCRSMLWVPITRQPESGLPPIGLLKIENRTPRGIRGFSLSAGPRQLFFRELWALAALQPYLTDLYESEDVLTPVHNNEAWRLRYQDNPLGLEYFDSLREWLKKREAEIQNKDEQEQIQEKEKIRESYKHLRDNLNWLLRFLSEAELLLQNIAYAHAVLAGKHPARYLHPDSPPAPSFFNAHNIGLAIRKAGVECGYQKETQGPLLVPCPPDSVAGQLQNKLKELRVSFSEESSVNQDGALPQLVRDVMTKLVGHETLPRDIAVFLGEPSDNQVRWDFAAAGECLLQCTREFAETLKDAPALVSSSKLSEPVQARIVVEQKAARRLTEEILQMGQDISKCVEVIQEETRDWALGELQWLEEEEKARRAREQDGGVELRSLSEDELKGLAEELITSDKATLLLLSRWSAMAGMGAHTFDEKDAYRLMFITGHVCQVLDTNLMQQARQRSIPVGFTDFALLGFDRDSLEWLNDLQMSAVQIAQTFMYGHNRDVRRQGEEAESVPCESLGLEGDLLKPFRERQNDIRAMRNGCNDSKLPVEVTILRIKGVLPDDVSPDKYPTLAALYRWLEGDVEGARHTEENEPKIERKFHCEARSASVCLAVPLSLIAKSEPLWLLRVQEALDELQEVLRDV